MFRWKSGFCRWPDQAAAPSDCELDGLGPNSLSLISDSDGKKGVVERSEAAVRSTCRKRREKQVRTKKIDGWAKRLFDRNRRKEETSKHRKDKDPS